MTNPVYELRKVSYSYGKDQFGLRDVSLTVQPGESVVVLGANGSGKSTLLKLLDGLYFASSGQVCAFGEPLTSELLQDEDWAFAFRRQVGLVFQDPDVQLFSPTVWDEVAFAPLHLGLARAEVIERAEWAIHLLGLEKLRDRAPHRLSGGEKKKVALASVLSLRPDVWLLDEPTASLDPRTQSRLLDFIGDLRREGKTIITATHSLDVIEELADRAVLFCEDHFIVGEGTPHEVLADEERLIACNLLHVHRHKHGSVEHSHRHLHGAAHEHLH